MKAAFHYVVKAKLIRLKSTHEVDFVEFEEKFENENPIEAREKAFQLYQNYIDVLLFTKGKQYTSDKQARIDLKFFADEPGAKSKIKLGGREIEFADTIANGIGVFLVIDKPKNEHVIEDHVGDEYLIHGIGGLGWADDPKSIMSSLTHECWYFDRLGINVSNLKRTIQFYEYDIAQAEPNIILETPYDWTGFNKPYSAAYLGIKFPAKEQSVLELLIKKGENMQVEFKPSLLFNHKTGKGGISIKGIIAKTICAFLNSYGGFLFIGITNKGEVQGLNFDYSLSNGKQSRDYFQLEFDQMLEHFLSTAVKSNVSGQFLEYEGKEVFVVCVLPSKHRPIFLNGQEGKEFFVRTEGSTRHINDIEEIANYCIDTWTS